MKPIRDWFDRHFSDPQVVVLIGLIVAALLVIIFIGNMLAPVIAALIIAFLLQGMVNRLKTLGAGHLLAVWVSFLAFMALMLFGVVAVVPLLISQVTALAGQIPSMVAEAQNALADLHDQYPQFISEEQVEQFNRTLRLEVTMMSQRLLAYSFSSVVAIVTVIVYCILVPFLVFFMVKDKDRIADWLTTLLPTERALTFKVWNEVVLQIGNYVRGKVWEILIVGVVTYVTFLLLGLNYALLLGALTGISVLIPYVGAAMVTFPVALVAYAQFGLDSPFVWVMIAYGIIQGLDGNVLVPILFSEAVDLHPIAIIVAILFFGGLWGFWGIFFAIPLATVVQAVLRTWPRASAEAKSEAEDQEGIA